MALLTRLLSLVRVGWLSSAPSRTDPLAGPPLEFQTQDGDLFMTADGVYYGVADRE